MTNDTSVSLGYGARGQRRQQSWGETGSSWKILNHRQALWIPTVTAWFTKSLGKSWFEDADVGIDFFISLSLQSKKLEQMRRETCFGGRSPQPVGSSCLEIQRRAFRLARSPRSHCSSSYFFPKQHQTGFCQPENIFQLHPFVTWSQMLIPYIISAPLVFFPPVRLRV